MMLEHIWNYGQYYVAGIILAFLVAMFIHSVFEVCDMIANKDWHLSVLTAHSLVQRHNKGENLVSEIEQYNESNPYGIKIAFRGMITRNDRIHTTYQVVEPLRKSEIRANTSSEVVKRVLGVFF